MAHRESKEEIEALVGRKTVIQEAGFKHEEGIQFSI
ncbi:uncharacterized protein G2W53_018154 [Senna tora]|uniref:Uncharacterized protein n=1 Tax=Senna tora TaxID=362788 RepID=A0A834TVB3_9FABA|nr:uncharacterized protein G2W53_018154 [Senna tora]